MEFLLLVKATRRGFLVMIFQNHHISLGDRYTRVDDVAACMDGRGMQRHKQTGDTECGISNYIINKKLSVFI